ncbi:tetratricopeptide repeat protein [Asticcacaulis sp. YBE204]|uniref:tetratricopeptide repeat protein n=1 Tax=Asticcacaulis sp. YBE204 TaxID=1282363 RepID=UPI0003C409C4|nr:tetratricopeptide repeat protein [Asticcacaulis sp. YBE204]ESQ79745.1 hypothetical protein AEYBE204_07835 [Asticcacaulis sp. YBE204]
MRLILVTGLCLFMSGGAMAQSAPLMDDLPAEVRPEDLQATRLTAQIAADAGDAAAQFRLAGMCDRGEGGPRDPAAAYLYYRKAADQNHVPALLVLGEGYDDDNASKGAFVYNRRAAEAGSSIGQFRMGYAYEHGMGVKADPAQAYVWYSRAARQQDSAATLGLENLKGRIAAKDRARAEGMLQ